MFWLLVSTKTSVQEFLWAFTFGDFHISAVASQGAVDLPDQLHVVEERVEAVEVWKADLVRRAATRHLGSDGDIYVKHKHTHSKLNKCLRDACGSNDYVQVHAEATC